MFVRLLKLPPAVREKYDLSSLKYVSHGGAPCPVDVKHEMMKWWGPILWEAYGASEGGGTVVSPQEWLRYPGTVGRAFRGGEIRILDDSGGEVPPNVVGNIYMRNYTGDRFEYAGDVEKTRAAYRGDLFTVGDVGYLNAEGYLFICDRRVDMILCGGMNIYSAEVERVLVTHPAVQDCAVFGVHDAIFGQIVVAVVQPAPQATAGLALTEDILRFLKGKLSLAKHPRRIEYTDALPRDPSGKLLKRVLKDRHTAAV